MKLINDKMYLRKMAMAMAMAMGSESEGATLPRPLTLIRRNWKLESNVLKFNEEKMRISYYTIK